MAYRIEEVKDKNDWKAFHRLGHYIYKRDPHWVAPLEKDIEHIFSPEHNRTFDDGEAKVWLMRNDQDKVIGRIAAFIDHRRNKDLDYPVGGLGFFECINDKEAAKHLLGHAEKYLLDKGMKAIDGPINFGERDKFWGLLTQGWYRPIYQENYHPNYYQAFFEDFGFLPHEQVLTFHGDIKDFPGERLHKLASRIRERYNMHCESLDLKDLPRGAQLFSEIYNQAFSFQPYFKPIGPEQVLDVLKEMKPIADSNLVCFCFADGKPVAFTGLIPDLNCHLKSAKGKLNIWSLPGFLWSLRFAKQKQAKGIAFGAIPEFQKKGATSVMVDYMYYLDNQANSRNHHSVVLATIRGHNSLMIKTMLTMNVNIQRIHTAYRKMLDKGLDQHKLEFIETNDVPSGQIPKTTLYPS